jgi:lipid-A-disaccharide synthase
MEAAGGRLSVHYREMAIMGGLEVIRHLGIIRKNRDICRHDILEFSPDAVILIDYSGFNLPMARFVSRSGFRVFYYISPKLWAWARWRVKTVRNAVNRMFVLLPFEVDFYKGHGVEAEYYGNPVLDSVEAYRSTHPESNGINDDGRPVIAMLAGSRRQEIDHLLPEMLSVIPHYPGYRFIIAGAPSIPSDYYQKYINGKNVEIVYNKTYELLGKAEAAIVTSGTATLETALFGVPEVVVYKTSGFNFFVGSFFVKVKYFSLVNLILDKEAVKELLQNNLSRDIKKELDRILFDKDYRSSMISDFHELRSIMGDAGVSERVAARIHDLLK